MGMGLDVVECPGESGPSVEEDFVSAAGSVPEACPTALTPLAPAAVAAASSDAKVDAVNGSLASLIILEMTSENTSKNDSADLRSAQ